MLRLGAVLMLVLGGCSEPTSEPSLAQSARERPAVPNETNLALRDALSADRTLAAMQAVDEAVAEDLPVRAAGILREQTLPAIDATIASVTALSLGTTAAEDRRDDALAILRRRRSALVQYADALDRGLVEDLVLLDAIRAQRNAEQELSAFLEGL